MKAQQNSTVAQDGRPQAAGGQRMPAEWERHASTWIAWPHNKGDWPGKFEPVPWVYAEIVRHLAAGERVNILVQPGKGAAEKVRGILEKSGVKMSAVRLHAVATDRVWVRDSGPIFVRRGKGVVPLWFRFNAWAKYANHRRDAQVPGEVGRILGKAAERVWGEDEGGVLRDFVLEGGSIDVNGAGCVLTTEECLLSKVQQRNPGFSREGIEAVLRGALGVEQVLWLGRGIAGDDTHGHIDDTARFVSKDTMVVCVERRRGDANYAATQENLRRARGMRDVRGRKFAVVELPLPEAVVFEGQRLPASYANFYIGNAGVLVPVFNDVADVRALKVLEGCFPGRAILPVYCRDLVWGLGTIHCLTQQEPAG